MPFCTIANAGKNEETPVDVESSETDIIVAKSVKEKTEEKNPFLFVTPELETLPVGTVRVEVIEGLSQERSWTFADRNAEHLFDTGFFAMKNLPNKYDQSGMLIRRKGPLLLHMTGRIQLPPGEYELRLRSVDAARLYLDGKLLTEIPINKRGSGAHSPYYEGLDRGPDILSMAEGHTEKTVTVKLDGGEHVLSVYRLFVTAGIGQHLGELIVAARPVEGTAQILRPVPDSKESSQQHLPFTDGGWLDFLSWEMAHLEQVNDLNRRSAAESQYKYWNRRHEYARNTADDAVLAPDVKQTKQVGNEIDRFLLAKLEEQNVPPTALLDDRAFLRRLCLDTIGMIPSPELITEFEALPKETRRSIMIDRLLDHPGWADHWVGYWQDVLAENPGIVKPQLNNTGPFRWFLYESFRDNKPFDRFVTELVMMDGDRYAGGPAAFGVASQNDAPMAAKAHIIGTAFLGVEMKCARCHDAPYHDITQEQVFNLAAMLKRGPQKVPDSSSIIADPEVLEQMTVKVTLPPGSNVPPEWPFLDLSNIESQPLPEWFLRNPKDSRERLAVTLTAPGNQRFSQMIVNRLWHRYLGWGLVEPIEDWEDAEISYPELLNYLARELVTNHYDLKHIARRIFNSKFYQREVFHDSLNERQWGSLFPGPVRRSLTAEQVTDSLYAVAGKPFGSEELTMNLDGRLSATSFTGFGIPRRAWEFVNVGNERDRPSLSLPTAQSIIQLLTAFGWRDQRQEPLTNRPQSLTPLQPLALANGVAANRAIDLSDRSGLTTLSLEDQSLDQFIDKLFTRILTRTPDEGERQMLRELLADGYSTRIIAGEEVVPLRRIYRSGVTWTSHFDSRADIEIVRRQAEILNGDPPTQRLNPAWRERVEDVVWSLVNSPEFVFVP